jgi:hypothetical protein
MITILNSYDKEIFEPLLSLLKNRAVPKKTSTSNRGNFPLGHRAVTFGITKGRKNGITGLSYYSKKFPTIYQEILKLGKLICPIDFSSIHLNNNVVCPKHYDGKNIGDSLLVSFGDYQGCNIVIEGVVYDAKYTPIIFNGAELEHWNTDDLIGNKYSLVFFNSFPNYQL